MKTETPRVRNVVDATRFWVHGCEPGRVSDGSRLALCKTLSIECPSYIFLWPVYFVISVPFSLPFFVCWCFSFFCSHWSLVLIDVPLISFCPADHVSDWQPRILLGMVEARSVNVKKTTTITTTSKGTSRKIEEKHTAHSEATLEGTRPQSTCMPSLFCGTQP